MARPKLFDFNDEREEIIRDTGARVHASRVAAARAGGDHLEYVLNEAAFREIERLVKYGSDDAIGEVGSLGFWRGVAKRVGNASDSQKERLLRDITGSYARDIAGNFDPKVYAFANKVIPVGLNLLFQAQSRDGAKVRGLRDRIEIEGDIETVASLAERGTLIVAPTHVSNLDSIVIGWALAEVGLPPVTYGAGKNLFSNPGISYFMQNLGAYKVDRRISHALYKECLKAYSEVLLERGYHSLFFPGGTRSRSGMVEEKLKLGLLGTGVSAYQRSLANGSPRPIYVVPLTLNFGLCLEAEGLIHDYLRAVGREYYLIPDDPFDSPLEVLRFITKIARMETSMVLRFGKPIDILGHAVDAQGNSYDSRGRRVDPARFFETAPGVYGADNARDREFTREAGEALADAFVRETVIMPTQFVSYVLFEAARRRFPDLDLARVLRFSRDLHIPWDEINAEAGSLRDRLRADHDAGRIRLFRTLLERSIPEIIDSALEGLGMYHPVVPAIATGQGVRLNNMNLLCYYSNRMRCLL